MTPNKGQLILQDIGSNKRIIETPIKNSSYEKYMKNIESVRENSRSKEGKSKIPLFAILPIICQTREDPLTWTSLIQTRDCIRNSTIFLYF